MQTVRRFLTGEVAHFRALPLKTQRFFGSLLVFGISSPLLGTFTTAYVVQQKSSVLGVCAFTFGIYLGVMLGFILTGKLLLRFSVSRLYAYGLLALGVSNVSVVLLSPTIVDGSWQLVVMGAGGVVYGLVAGIYWGNRMLLTVDLTHDRNRDFFFGLESAMNVTLAVAVPILFGALIEYRFFLPAIFDRHGSFMLLLSVAVVLLALGARQIMKEEFTIEPPQFVTIGRPVNNAWIAARLLLCTKGTLDACVALVPVILTLTVLGGELMLGAIQSLSGVATAAAVYWMGRVAGRLISRAHISMIAGAVVIGMSVLLAYRLDSATVVAFIIGANLAMALLWNATNPIVFLALERALNSESEKYAFLVDREVWLSIGRMAAVALFVVLQFTLGAITATTFLPLFLAPMQIGLMWAACYLDRTLDKNASVTVVP